MSKLDIEGYKRNLSTDAIVEKIFGSKCKEFNKVRDGQWEALCPFHDDHKKGNFNINLKDGVVLYNCLACHHGGSIIDFVLETHLGGKKDFNDAVEEIKNLTGIVPNGWTDKGEKKTISKKPLPSKWQEYLRGRGLTDFYGIEYYYEDWTDDKGKEWKGDVLKIPFYNPDPSEKAPEYGGWTFILHRPGRDPKYANPKKEIFYPFNYKALRGRDNVWLFEGVFDALSFNQNESINAVSITGTFLRDYTANLLKAFDSVVVAMDNDKAGRAAALEVIITLYEKGVETVYTVEYKGFPYKDINEAYQNNDRQAIELIKRNIYHGYEAIVEANPPIGETVKETDEKVTAAANLIARLPVGARESAKAYYKKIYEISIDHAVNLLSSQYALEDFGGFIKEFTSKESFDKKDADLVLEKSEKYKKALLHSRYFDLTSFYENKKRPAQSVRSFIKPGTSYSPGTVNLFVSKEDGSCKNAIREAVEIIKNSETYFPIVHAVYGRTQIEAADEYVVEWLSRKYPSKFKVEFYRKNYFGVDEEYGREIRFILDSVKIIEQDSDIAIFQDNLTYIAETFGAKLIVVDPFESELKEKTEEIDELYLRTAIRLKIPVIRCVKFLEDVKSIRSTKLYKTSKQIIEL